MPCTGYTDYACLAIIAYFWYKDLKTCYQFLRVSKIELINNHEVEVLMKPEGWNTSFDHHNEIKQIFKISDFKFDNDSFSVLEENEQIILKQFYEFPMDAVIHHDLFFALFEPNTHTI